MIHCEAHDFLGGRQRQRRPPAVHQVRSQKFGLQIRLFQPEGPQVQQRMGGRAGGQRVHAGQQVPEVTIAVDQRPHPGLAQGLLRIGI